MTLSCIKWPCIVHMLAVLANIGLILLIFYMFFESRAGDRFLALLFLIPPVLSLLALRSGGDKEEQQLKKRIRKAKLRQELKGLEDFDQP